MYRFDVPTNVLEASAASTAWHAPLYNIEPDWASHAPSPPHWQSPVMVGFRVKSTALRLCHKRLEGVPPSGGTRSRDCRIASLDGSGTGKTAKSHHCFAGQQCSMPQLRPASPAAPPSDPWCAMHAHCWRPGPAPFVSAPWLPTVHGRVSLHTSDPHPHDAQRAQQITVVILLQLHSEAAPSFPGSCSIWPSMCPCGYVVHVQSWHLLWQPLALLQDTGLQSSQPKSLFKAG